MFDRPKVVLDRVFKDVTDRQFEAILSALRLGEISSSARCIQLVVDEDCKRANKKKNTLAREDWEAFSLRLDGDKGIHLVDSQGCQAHTEITLKSTEVNKLLGFTSQAGGAQSKMGPKVYAYLAAGYAHGEIKLAANPTDLFTELEALPELWDERGPINQVRGIAAVQEFLAIVARIDQQLSDGISIDDISFAGDV